MKIAMIIVRLPQRIVPYSYAIDWYRFQGAPRGGGGGHKNIPSSNTPILRGRRADLPQTAVSTHETQHGSSLKLSISRLHT